MSAPRSPSPQKRRPDGYRRNRLMLWFFAAIVLAPIVAWIGWGGDPVDAGQPESPHSDPDAIDAGAASEVGGESD